MPAHDELVRDLADLKIRLQHLDSLSQIEQTLDEIQVKQSFLERVEALHEQNPMLGTRGVGSLRGRGR